MARATSAATLASPYRLPLFPAPDRELTAGYRVAAVVGAVVLAAAYLAPLRSPEITDVDEVPERFARLILEEPVAARAPEVKLPAPPKVEVKAPTPTKPPPPKPAARRTTKPKVADNRGEAGRERAQQQVAQLEKVSGSLDRVLADVSASLANTETPTKSRRPSRRRKARSGRSADQVAAGTPIPATVNAGAGALAGALVQLGDATGIELPETSATRADGSTAAAGEIRSDVDLMAVVRKYAPGLQFCYDNELKKAPGLGGKLIVTLTVAASGRVTDVAVATDTVGSAAMKACALTQIRAWRFPEVPEGTVTFQAPFVFTPPK